MRREELRRLQLEREETKMRRQASTGPPVAGLIMQRWEEVSASHQIGPVVKGAGRMGARHASQVHRRGRRRVHGHNSSCDPFGKAEQLKAARRAQREVED